MDKIAELKKTINDVRDLVSINDLVGCLDRIESFYEKVQEELPNEYYSIKQHFFQWKKGGINVFSQQERNEEERNLGRNILTFLDLLKAEKQIKWRRAGEEERVEMIVNLDRSYENFSENDKDEVVKKITKLINIIPERVWVIEVMRGSVRLKLSFPKTKVLQLVSLYKLNLLNIPNLQVIRFVESEFSLQDYMNYLELIGLTLSGINLIGADLRGADLRGADLRGADLRGAYLTEADLRGADLTGTDLTGAYLRGADLTEAYLRGADLRGAYLTEANLTGADLRGANLTIANLKRAKALLSQRDELISIGAAVSDMIFIDDFGKEIEIFELV